MSVILPIRSKDLIIVVTGHDNVDYDALAARGRLIINTRKPHPGATSQSPAAGWCSRDKAAPIRGPRVPRTIEVGWSETTGGATSAPA